MMSDEAAASGFLVEFASYHTFKDNNVTVCCLTLVNGLAFIGEAICASELKFRADFGRRQARKSAERKMRVLRKLLKSGALGERSELDERLCKDLIDMAYPMLKSKRVRDAASAATHCAE
jgi:hypothetical protein